MTRDDVIESWLTITLESHFRDEPSSELLQRILAAHTNEPETAHRGLRLLVASAVVAAAATVALIFLLPERTTPAPNQPAVVTEHNAPVETDEWESLQTIVSDGDTLVDTGADEAVLTRGAIRVQVEPGQTYRVIAGPHTLVLTGPARARVTMSPMRQMGPAIMPPTGGGTGNPALAQLRSVPMVALAVNLDTGTATLDGIELTGPAAETRILRPVTGDEPWAAPLTMKELFAMLDENGDIRLRVDEVTPELVKLLDKDGDGGITFAEFETLDMLQFEQTPKVIPFSREFREMDRDGDGKLSGDEIGEDIVRIADRDGSGGLELKEAESIFGGMGSTGGGGGGAMLTDMFAHFDVNENGKIDADEIAPDVLIELDTDESGDLSRAEFRRFTPERFPAPLTPEQSFKRNDKNDDGELDDKEVPPEMIRMGDTDGDGKLSLAEFKKLVNDLAPRGK